MIPPMDVRINSRGEEFIEGNFMSAVLTALIRKVSLYVRQWAVREAAFSL